MPNSIVDLFSGGSSGTPLPYELQLAQLQRQQRLADQLQQQASQPIDVQQGGGAPAPISWGSVLAKALQGAGSGLREVQSENQYKQLGQQDNDAAQALIKQLAPSPGIGTGPIAPQTASMDATMPQLPGGPAPTPQTAQVQIPGAAAGAAPMVQPDQNQMLAAVLGARGGPQTQMIQQAMLPQIMNRQNLDYEHLLNRGDLDYKNAMPMSAAEQQQIAAQGQQAQQNALFQNKLGMTAAEQAQNALGYAQLNKPEAVGFGQQLVNPKTGKVVFNGGGASTTVPTDKNGLPLTGAAYLSTLPPNVQGIVKAIGDYRQAPMTAMALRSPQGAQIAEAVNLYNPQYDASQYGTKVKARNDFSTGKNGNTVRSLNVAVQHLDQLGQLSQALGNGDMQAVNRLGQFIGQQTGSAAPTNFTAAKQLVGDEIVKAIVGAGGGVGDREEAARNISSASSPQQLAGVIQTYKGLMAGQLSGLKQQYEAGTGLKDFEKNLAPETVKQLQMHQGQNNSGNIPAPPPGFVVH